MKSENYDIKELCAEAKVTPRTVHFYIQQGLIPPACSQGPGARYDQGHLARLKLIRLLKREHLPLSEIRLRLESLDDAKVQELVREYSSRKQPANSSAVEYIRGVLAGTRSPQLQGSFDMLTVGASFGQASEQRRFFASTHQPAERSRWDRILLAPDVELHIRRPLSRSQNRKIDAIIQYARETLKEEES